MNFDFFWSFSRFWLLLFRFRFFLYNFFWLHLDFFWAFSHCWSWLLLLGFIWRLLFGFWNNFSSWLFDWCFLNWGLLWRWLFSFTLCLFNLFFVFLRSYYLILWFLIWWCWLGWLFSDNWCLGDRLSLFNFLTADFWRRISTFCCSFWLNLPFFRFLYLLFWLGILGLHDLLCGCFINWSLSCTALSWSWHRTLLIVRCVWSFSRSFSLIFLGGSWSLVLAFFFLGWGLFDWLGFDGGNLFCIYLILFIV